tara:strand:+ start:4638 stop:5300 length:663 start_codon:yes stop_codon:yes gene_type:complete
MEELKFRTFNAADSLPVTPEPFTIFIIKDNTEFTIQVSDEASNYLTQVTDGFVEINDLTAAVVWANVPSLNITQASVTQHQAALSITESQISDLSHFTPTTLLADYTFTDNSTNWNLAFGWGDHSTGGYLTSFTETNDLTGAVTWANVPNTNITVGSVTQHQASLSITESQISDLSNYVESTATGEPTGSDVVNNMVSLTQTEYDAGTPVATTFYVITGA